MRVVAMCFAEKAQTDDVLDALAENSLSKRSIDKILKTNTVALAEAIMGCYWYL